MDYSHFRFPMSDSAYPVINGYYPKAQTSGHGHQPSDFSNASSDFLPHGLYLPRDSSADLFDDGEDGDGESKTRLSPEQMAELEREFRMNHKPKTERKKLIAHRLRLQLPRVNNWYQNRRAKAKHQRPSTQEYDVSSNDEVVTSPEQGFSSMTSVSQAPKSDSCYHRPTDSGVDFSHGVDLGLEGFDFGLENAAHLTERGQDDVHVLPNSGYSSAISSAITPQHGAGVNPMWANEDFCIPMPRSFTNITTVGNGSIDHSPQSSDGVLAYEAGLDPARKAKFDPASIHMYHDLLTDNLSNQDMTTTADAGFLMTPPTDTPTLPWMVNELHSRRTSDSSELATNFASNLHVQQAGVGLGVSATTISPSTVFRTSLNTPPVLTPDISPDQATAKSASTFDLASRRKAQRPEPLVRPSTERSHSYGGPPTMSPRQRVPSHGLKSSKSSNVLRGRVSKPNSAAASPRHFQTQFETRRPNEVQASAGRDPIAAAVSGANFTNFAQVSPATSVHSASGYWDAFSPAAPQLYGNPNAYSSVPDLSTAASQPHSMLSHHLQSRPRQAQPSEYDTPQSAPSHQTTFNLPESPSIHGEAFTSQNWPVSQYPAGYGLVAPQMAAARPSGHLGAHGFGGPGYQPPFAPKVHPGFLTGQSYFPAWSQHQIGYTQSSGQPEHDFKVELETKPNQIFVKTSSSEFNFANSTPKDYNSPGGKKK